MNLEGYENVKGLTDKARRVMSLMVHQIKSFGTPENPILSQKFEDAHKITGSEVRAIISYCRVERHLPIGSGAKGYYWMTDPDDVDETVKHLDGRILRMQIVRKELIKTQQNMINEKRQTEIF